MTIAGARPIRFAVVGAGISGLAATRRLHQLRPEAEIVLYEAAERAGGKLRRVEVGGARIDVGAESMLVRRPEAVTLASELGLDQIHPRTTSALLRNRGGNRLLPARTVMGIPADLDALERADVVSAQTLDRIAAEPADQPALEGDVSVGELVADRFGDEVVDRLVEPLLGGVYAGRARAISTQAALPALYRRLHEQGGSLRAAVQAGLPPASPVPPTAAAPVFASLPGGLARLAESIAADGSFRLVLGTPVRRISRTASGFRLELGAASGFSSAMPAVSAVAEVDGVVLATPAGKTATLLAELAPVAAAELAGIETASMAIVTLAFAGRPALPAGSGLLIPAVEGLACKAMTFSSQKWPGVGADAGVFLLRASLGRAGDERTLQYEDAELVSIMRRELAQLTGVTAEPVDQHVQRWGGALPQYAVGHVDRVERIRHAVAAVPGLAVCGASYDGVGIPACIASARLAADRVSQAGRPVAQ
ncbi:MAG TPA: protoporphyrinogen oxidase [Jatrophihabitans sp.]|nr:protoporphyrinogen oxidase [Jatrophihabitans sp.]